jgi:hypothetical protein
MGRQYPGLGDGGGENLDHPDRLAIALDVALGTPVGWYLAHHTGRDRIVWEAAVLISVPAGARDSAVTGVRGADDDRRVAPADRRADQQ